MIASLERWLLVLAGGAVTLLITGFLCFRWGDASRGAKDDAKTEASVVTAAADATRAAQKAVDAQVNLDTAETQIASLTATKQAATVTITRTLIEKVPTYVPAKADTGCTITRGAVDVLNASAAGRDLPSPDSGSNPDAAAPGVALSDVVASVAGNYGICHIDESQITGLQATIKAYQASTAH